MVVSLEFATFLLLASACAVGVAAAVARTWSLHSRLYSLEDRVSVLEGVTQREVKIRAAETRLRKPSKDEELLVAKLAATEAVTTKKNWWELPLPRQYTG